MDIRNCPKCERIFQYAGRNLCPVCVQEEEAEYEKVRDYLRDHEGSSVDEVAEATGVDPKAIMHFLRQGRLLVKDGFSSGLYCESCGAPISGGRFCDKCSKAFSKELSDKLGEWDDEARLNNWGMHSQENKWPGKKA